MKRKAIIIAVIILVLGLEAWQQYKGNSANTNSQSDLSTVSIYEAYSKRLTNIQIKGVGTVKKVLPDDLDGSRHQRFILNMGDDLSVLVAHNIDLAPKIAVLRKADTVSFYGEYEWTSKGGVVHWTHHDPAGRHPGGWLKHNGKLYQ